MENASTVTNDLYNSWDNIKHEIAEINGVKKISSFNSNLTYTNEDIMVMFIFKLNDRYRYSSLVDFGLLNDLDKLFIESYDTKQNYLDYAIPKVENYISDMQKKVDQIKSEKDVKSKPLIFNVEQFFENNEKSKIDSVLISAAVPQLTNLAKYRYLAKLLYEKDKKYLDLAKESIILNNISLDMIVFGSDDLTRKSNQTTSVEHFNNNSNCSNVLIICIILILIIIFRQVTFY